MREIKVNILRGSENGRGEYRTYEVKVDDGAVVSVMNLLEKIYEEQDHTLAFFSHTACRQAACGKCMVKVDGAVKLACKERVDAGEITIEPYCANVVRDLICEA